MKLSLAAFVDPDRSGVYGTVAVAATLFLYARPELGFVGIVVSYALWLPLIAIRPSMLKVGRVEGILFVLPAFVLLSTLWSDAPWRTLGAAAQFAVTLTCALVAARTLSLRTILLGVVVCGAAIAGEAFIDGASAVWAPGPDGRPGGIADERDRIGLVAGLAVVAALALAGVVGLARRRTLAALALAAPSALVLVLAQSTMSLLAAGAAGAILGALLLAQRLDADERHVVHPWLVTVAVGIVAVAMSAVVFADLARAPDGAAAADAGPGRIELAGEGLVAAGGAPHLGTGYRAFWVTTNETAKRLWTAYDVHDRASFGFHNAFVEVLVDLGGVGLVLFLAQIVWRIAIEWRSHLSRRASRRMIALTAVTVFFLVRSVGEVDLHHPLEVGTFLMTATSLKAAGMAGRRPASRRSRGRKRAPRQAALSEADVAPLAERSSVRRSESRERA